MNEEPQIVGFAANANQTTVHPIGLLAVVILGICVLIVPRRWSTIPFLIIACFIPSAQRIVIASLDFDFLRIMVIFGLFRIMMHKEHLNFVRKPLDKIIIFWTISSVFFMTLRVGTLSVLINRIGFAFDVIGMYFVFRCLIKSWADLDKLIYGIILISIPVAIFMFIENKTGRNLFAIFGGVSEFTGIRDGRLRCQGAFSSPILAGCFWASCVPLIGAFWWKSQQARMWSVMGIITSLVIIFCSASSTPIMGLIAAILGGLMFYFKAFMRHIRWGIAIMIVLLHIIMKAPVWHLISRVSAVGGSTGYHRYILIDRTINHFSDWWFSGCSGYVVLSWGIYRGDVTNQYIAEGVNGGLLTMALFIALIAYAYRDVGRLWRMNKKNAYQLALSWALGCSLFVHCVNYIGVSYFGQIVVARYLLFAIIASLSVSKSLYFKRSCPGIIESRLRKVGE